MKKKRFDAILACRVGGSRLYGKPLQFLDIENRITILEYLVKYIKQINNIDSICLAIAEGKANYGFVELAEKEGWAHVFGEENDMLGRMVKAACKLESDLILIGSSESPFLYYEMIDALFEQQAAEQINFSTVTNLPDGTNFSLVDINTLRVSHENGTARHKELVTSYIFDNQDRFKINMVKPESKLRRSDIRLTVDYPEDLAFCRHVYCDLKGKERLIKVADIIDYWDANKELRKPVETIGVDWGHGRIWE
jgi:spore coat polysaccharide biosynthesis protein SpsF